ncbi:thiamine pyrophosphate-binding protein [Pseudenhygromyxa sp. WMMC2535]|uniref:thiamine pyrophosphate-dependent enzyme n=1 Tax=Pseudenhygromyxa sp. WMMC2535 TaxID=2712867 RepID=UPI00155700EF|nr:thiamine pyrophosphate-dependent enzyme [Pseudenhygromyxa sp. WMMC2535]NVB37326.1 thiamine pyrophosphate-binding protein [Pseudenhygromyxa sp. WMMC2535]
MKPLEITRPRETIAEALARVLVSFGVRRGFGLIGGGIARFCAAMRDAGINLIHARHETGAAFMASEAHFASGEPVVVFTTTGPGASNAITGLISAACDGAKIITVAAATNHGERARRAFQETGPGAMDISAWVGSPQHQLQFVLESPNQLPMLCRQLAVGLARPGGFVANLMLPLSVQAALSPISMKPMALPLPPLGSGAAVIPEVYERLASGKFVIWVGFGAREHAAEVLAFAERTGVPVMASPRAKGIFPESHPQYLGVTGMFGGHDRVQRHLRKYPVDHILVLGSRLGEATSCYDPVLAPQESLIHVDVDPSVFGLGYPEVETVGVVADIGEFLPRLRACWTSPCARQLNETKPVLVPPPGNPGPIHPCQLMAAIQRVVVEGSTATVLADVGNAFAWANLELRFDTPGRYRISPSFAAMTHASSGVVGAALASEVPAVAIVGDGAMLMGNELSTAVKHDAEAKWIILNDSSYGMVRHGMKAVGLEPFETDIPRTDFVGYARALGAAGLRVRDVDELEPALEAMLAMPGPVVVDVTIDPEPAPPFGRRNASLEKLWS